MTFSTEEPDRPPSFSYDEVGELIASATRLQELAGGGGTVSFAELQQVAAELKISPEALRQALATSESQSASLQERVQQKLFWYRHTGIYAASMGMCAGIDLFHDGVIDWVPYPILGWGIVIGIHAIVAFSGKGSRLEQALMKREAETDRA